MLHFITTILLILIGLLLFFLNNVDYFYDYDVDYYRPPLLANNRWNSIFIKNDVLKKRIIPYLN
jgi:hypothetical protein